MTCSKNLEVEGEYELKPIEDAVADGVGERLMSMGLFEDSENERDKNWVGLLVAGIGVETPSALASLARRWGGNGDFGGPHVGDKVAFVFED